MVVVPIALIGFVACVTGQRSYHRLKREMTDTLTTNRGDSARSTDIQDMGQSCAA
jgi:hypothetical protein